MEQLHSAIQPLPGQWPGGLIVDGAMEQVPNNCLALAQSETNPSAINYFYAVHDDGDDITVNNVFQNSIGKIQLVVSGVIGNAGDTISVACVNIAGAFEANVIDAATVLDSTDIELLNTTFTGVETYTGGGNCHVVRLAASTTGHAAWNNGVQQENGNVHYTLVGMCYIGPSNAVYDTPTQRDCASWYNRGLKTCVNVLPGDQTTTSTAFTEINPGIECQFVTWGTGDPTSQSDLSWSISGMMSNSIGTDGVAASAGFDSSAPIPETEEAAAVNPLTSVGGFPLAVAGSKTGLSEGKHFITVLGKTITGGTAKYFGSVPDTSLEIRIPQ